MAQTRKAPRKRKLYSLNPKKHGLGGLSYTKPTRRKQDRRAKPLDGYAVFFFPKINGIGPAEIWHNAATGSLSATPAAAIAKHLDGIVGTWAEAQRAGWRVRKVRVNDLGDAK